MGEMEVPADALYGASTQRAVENFPISGQRMPRRFLRALALIKLAAAETNGELGLLDPDVAGRDRGGGGLGRRRRPRRPVPDRHLPDRLGDLDQHQHERGHRPPRERPARRSQGPSERRRQPLPELERHDPDGAPAVGRGRDRGGSCCPPSSGSTPALAAKEQAFWPIVKTGRTHLQDATPIRLGQEFRGYAGPGRGVAPSRARGAGRAARGAARRDRGRDRDQRPPGVRVPDLRAAVGADRAGGPRDRPTTSTPRPRLDAAIAAHGAIRTHRPQPLEDRLGHPADGDGSAGRPRGARPARDPAGLEHHARQGEPGHRREPDDGRRPGRRQRRDDRLRADRQLARAQRDAAR